MNPNFQDQGGFIQASPNYYLQPPFPPFIPMPHNPVNNPEHYNQGGIECIKAIEASMSDNEYK
jgi:Protein of unknwon function (DUF3310)